jgi:hypothetical protein
MGLSLFFTGKPIIIENKQDHYLVTNNLFSQYPTAYTRNDEFPVAEFPSSILYFVKLLLL